MNDQLWHFDATELARLVATRQVSAREVVAAALTRADALGWLGAFASLRADRALDEATLIDGRPLDERPRLAGVPFAIKDWKCTVAGEPMWWGTRLLRDVAHVATATTELASRYDRAGLISLGRTALPELAFGPPTTEPDAGGPTLNPWDTDHSVGGSSGGSAAAVAAGIVPIANASDGGGSLRIPAACCGLVGLKVSRGRLTNAPHADGRSIKVEGHVARTVRDVALLLDLTTGAAAGDEGTRLGYDDSFVAAIAAAPSRLRIGIMTDAPGAMNPDGPPHPSHVAAVREVADRLAGLGHDVVEAHPAGLDRPLQTPNLYAAERAVLRATLESIVGRQITVDDVEPRTWAMFELAGRADGIRVLEEIDREQRWARDVRQWWSDGFDLLLTPTLGRDVPRIGELKETASDPLGASIRGYPMAWFTYPFNITGQPAITIPVDWSTPVPIGVQLVGAMGREDVLLALAAVLEQEYRWHHRWASCVGPDEPSASHAR